MMYWDYLDDESFLIRQYSVLHFLKDYDHIIEIGCGKNPISKFLTDKTFTLIEPDFDMSVDVNNQIIHHKEKIQEIDISKINISAPYALVIFGLDWAMCPQQKLLWDHSNLAIFESITTLHRHVEFLEEIKRTKKPTLEYDLHIYYDKEISAQSWPPRPDRKILIYK